MYQIPKYYNLKLFWIFIKYDVLSLVKRNRLEEAHPFSDVVLSVFFPLFLSLHRQAVPATKRDKEDQDCGGGGLKPNKKLEPLQVIPSTISM